METSRKAVKAPVLELGRKIDAIAATFLEECSKQEGRLQGLINHYQRKQLEAKNDETGKLEEMQERAAQLRKEGREAEAFDLEMSLEIAVVPGIDKPRGLAVRQRINFQVVDPILFVQAWPQFWKRSDENETLRVDRMRVLDELNKPNGNGAFHKTRFPEELSANDDPRLVRPAGLRVYEEIKAHVR
jgi:hypothetical protein